MLTLFFGLIFVLGWMLVIFCSLFLTVNVVLEIERGITSLIGRFKQQFDWLFGLTLWLTIPIWSVCDFIETTNPFSFLVSIPVFMFGLIYLIHQRYKR